MVLCLAGLAACSDAPELAGGNGDARVVDAGPLDAGDAGTPEEPQPPAPPVFTPCPEGWEAVLDESGVEVCEPWPGGGPVNWPCPEGWSEVTVDGEPDATHCSPGDNWDPVQWSCPDGWHRVEYEDGSHACDPYGSEGTGTPDACGPFEAHFPGEPGCVTVGTVCPAGPFAEDLPTDVPIVYVQPGATGDGSSAQSPLGSLDDVPFEDLSADTVVALAKGVYLGRRTLSRSVTLWGACPAETVLQDLSTSSNEPAVVTVRAGVASAPDQVGLVNLRIGESRATGVSVSGRVALDLDGVIVEATEVAGVVASDGAQLTLQSSVVRDTRPRASDDAFGRGLDVQLGARAEVRRTVFASNRGFGVLGSDADTELLLEDTAVRDTQERASDPALGIGLGVRSGARAAVRRALFASNRVIGVFVNGPGSELMLEHSVVKDTRERASDRAFGQGLQVQGGGRAELLHVLIASNRDVGVVGIGVGSELVLQDAVVRDTRERASDGAFGTGLGLESGARAEVFHAVIASNRDLGVLVRGAGTELVLEDAVVRDTRERASDGALGRGLNVQGGARAEVRRAQIASNREVGVAGSGAGTELVLEHAVVRDTRERASGDTLGIGLGLRLGARAEVYHALIASNRWSGVSVFDADTELVLEDAVVRDTREQLSDGDFGPGLTVGFGARAEVRRALIANNRETGIGVFDADLRLEDAVVRDTESVSDGTLGRGLTMELGARAEVRRVLIRRNRELGILASGGDTELVLEDAVVRDTRERAVDEASGLGLATQSNASVDVRRARFVNNRREGARAYAAQLTVEDTMIQQTRRPRCEETGDCFAPAVNSGLSVIGTATVTAARLVVESSAICGLFLGDGADLADEFPDLFGLPIFIHDEAVVRANRIGLCVQSPELDLSSLTNIALEDNEVNLDKTNFPTPRPFEPI